MVMMKRIIPLFLFVLITASFLVSAGKAFAKDDAFYSGNDILFFDPDAKSCSSTAIATSGDNKGNAYNYFVSKGLNALQSAAIVGNFQQESGVEPKALNSIGAYGIAQWLSGRKANLMAKSFYTSGATDKSKELQVQLDFVWEELHGGESGALTKLTSSTSTDPKELAIIFGESYERYGSSEAGNRAQFAADIYNQYGSTVATGTNNCSNTGAGNFVYYSQNDPKWATHSYGAAGTIGPAGCGPTSMAMIVATLADKNVTPIDTADLGVANGSAFSGGTIHLPLIKAAAEKWGLNYTDIGGQSLDVAIETVKAGGLVYMGGQGPAPFTTEGHIIVMRGVTDDGKIIIGDPYRGGADVYDRSTVEAYRTSSFAITKK